MTQNILNTSVHDFISATASKQPTPGGGSVAGVVGALGTALGEMALNFTIGKKKFAEHEAFYAVLSGRLEKSRKMFASLVADDMAAFGMYCDANAMPEGPAKELALEEIVDRDVKANIEIKKAKAKLEKEQANTIRAAVNRT